MAVPHVPFDPDEAAFPLVRAAQQLRRMEVQPVLVEPDSPAQALPHPGYYVPEGFLRPGAPAAVVVREDLDGDGREEAMVMMRGALHHAAARFGLSDPAAIVACDEAASTCGEEEAALLRQELATWWNWWAPRNRRPVPVASPARRPLEAAA